MSATLFSARTLVLLTLAVMMAPQMAVAQSSSPSREPLVVEADESLQWRRDDRQYIATGNAVATQGNTVLEADTITADYTENAADSSDDINISRIVGEGGAKLTEPDYQAVAGTIEYSLETNVARLRGGDLTITADDGTVTATETIVYNRGERLVVATGTAQIALSNGQRINGDRIEVDLDAGERDFTAIRAFGNAEVFSPEADRNREARAENITYTRASGIAILTGSVEILDGSNRMTGDKAEINTVTGISTMTATGGRVGGVFTP
ncbi:MAG: LptA/OstA family protein [Candidatus Puniceispirillales bacterium]